MLTCAFEGRLHLVHAEEAIVVPVEVVERLPEFCGRGSTQNRSAQLVPRRPSEVLTPCEAALLVLDNRYEPSPLVGGRSPAPRLPGHLALRTTSPKQDERRELT